MSKVVSIRFDMSNVIWKCFETLKEILSKHGMPNFKSHEAMMNLCKIIEFPMKIGLYRIFGSKLSLQEVLVAALPVAQMLQKVTVAMLKETL